MKINHSEQRDLYKKIYTLIYCLDPDLQCCNKSMWCFVFAQWPARKHSTWHRRGQRDRAHLLTLQHLHVQARQNARCVWSCCLYYRVAGERALSNLCLYLIISEACGSKSVYDGPEQEEYSSFVIDDPQETYKILKHTVSAVQKLEQQHAQYKREKFRKTKYGSQWVAVQIFPIL